MSYQTEILTDYNLVLTRISGVMDDKSNFAYSSSLSKTKYFHSSYNQLADSRMATKNLLTHEGVIKISNSSAFEPSVKRAFVVNDEQAAMFATLFGVTTSESNNYFVTRDIHRACEWLGVSYAIVMAASLYQT